jgi:hypothetical protein
MTGEIGKHWTTLICIEFSFEGDPFAAAAFSVRPKAMWPFRNVQPECSAVLHNIIYQCYSSHVSVWRCLVRISTETLTVLTTICVVFSVPPENAKILPRIWLWSLSSKCFPIHCSLNNQSYCVTCISIARQRVGKYMPATHVHAKIGLLLLSNGAVNMPSQQ